MIVNKMDLEALVQLIQHEKVTLNMNLKTYF
jgi:hypothetical protein